MQPRKTELQEIGNVLGPMAQVWLRTPLNAQTWGSAGEKNGGRKGVCDEKDLCPADINYDNVFRGGFCQCGFRPGPVEADWLGQKGESVL